MARKSQITDPNLNLRLQKLAKSIGVGSLRELAIALADGGYFDKISPPMEVLPLSRTQVGSALLSQKPEDQEDPEFFRGLISAQQTAIVLHLMSEGDSAQRVAARFWLPVEEILRVWNRYAAKIGEDVMQVRFESFIGTLALRVEDLYHRALSEERNGAVQASNIYFKYIKTMQELGVLYRAPVQVEHGLTKEDQDQTLMEAKRIVELSERLEKSETKDAKSDVREIAQTQTGS